MNRLWKALIISGAAVGFLVIVIGEAVVLTRWQETALRYQEVQRKRDQMAARLSPVSASFEKDKEVVLHQGVGQQYHRKVLPLNGKAPGYTEIWDGWQSVLPIDVHSALGAILEKTGKYAEAKTAYTEALTEARSLAADAEKEAAQAPNDDERRLFAALCGQAEDKVCSIERLLQSDAMRLGADGCVLFEGKWLKPAEAKEIEDRRKKQAELAFEKAQQDKGLVKVDDQWVTKAEAEEIAKDKFEAQQRKKGLVFYNDKWVTREDKRAAEAALKADKERAAAAAAAQLAASPFAPNKKEWLLDDFKSGVPWQAEAWADLVSVDVTAEKGVNWMSILYPGGPCSKACLVMPLAQSLDLSSRTRLLLDLNNTGGAKTAVSVIINAGLSYETQSYDIAPGEHKDFSIPISGKVFKCPVDNWQKYAFAIPRPQSVSRIGLMINEKAQLLVTRVRLVAE